MQKRETESQVYSMDETLGNRDTDTNTSKYDKILALEAELSAYRRGAIRIRLDFEKHMIFWRDSRQWNNNFFRSVAPNRMAELLRDLPSTHLLEWTVGDGNGASDMYPACIPSSWQVSVFFTDESTMKFIGQDCYPRDWKRFRELLEGVARIPFCLR
jgi:hypothetical protein